MQIGILSVLLSCAVVTQCDIHHSPVDELKSFDFMHLFDEASLNLTSFDDVTQSALIDEHGTLHARGYDSMKCATELRAIGDALGRTEWWAIQCKIFKNFFRKYLRFISITLPSENITLPFKKFLICGTFFFGGISVRFVGQDAVGYF